MKNFKFLKHIIFIFSMLLAVFSYSSESKASGAYFKVSNITSTSVNLDWSALATKSMYKTPVAYTISWWSASLPGGVEEVFVLKETKQTSATISNLPSGTSILFKAYVHYSDNSCTVEDSIVVKTPGATTNPNQKPTTPNTTTPSTTTPTTTNPTTPSKPTTTNTTTATFTAPVIGQALLSGTRAQAAPSKCSSLTQSFEWKICDKKTNAVIGTTTSSLSYSVATFYNLTSRKIYYIQCRSKAYTNGGYVYSPWSSPVYVISQPKVDTSSKNIKKNSIKVKYKKIAGAKDYTIYARKYGSSKWSKIKTTKKASYTMKKIKGKGINVLKNKYQYCVVANAKVNGKTIHSRKDEFVTTTVRYVRR